MGRAPDPGWAVSPVDDNIYEWRVEMSGFSTTSLLAQDLARLKQRHGYDYVSVSGGCHEVYHGECMGKSDE